MNLRLLAPLMLLIAGTSQAQAQSPTEAMDFVSEGCSNTNGSPADVETMKTKFGDSFDQLAPLCLVYVSGWQKGFGSGIGDGSQAEYLNYCRRVIGRIARNGAAAATYEADLLASYPNAANRAVVATICDTYKTAFQEGLIYARDLTSR